MSVSIDFSSPQRVGGLDTFDPLDPRVAAFWKDGGRHLSRHPRSRRLRPEGGFGGPPRPSAYGRTHADAANVIARALAPHRGVIFYRGFVYDHHMDWRNPKNDRARAAYDNFHPLDGKFDANVVVQIKHGPIDFQVREPASPLFGALSKPTRRSNCRSPRSIWASSATSASSCRCGRRCSTSTCGRAGRRHAGKRDRRRAGRSIGPSVDSSASRTSGATTNWLGHDLAMANLYGFGRLAWNPDLTSRAIADEWTRLTFGTIRRSSRRSRASCSIRGRPTSATPGRSAPERSPTSSVCTTGRGSSRRSETAGASGTAPTDRASEWTARSPPGPASLRSTRPPVAREVRISRNLPRRAAAVLSSRPVHPVLHSGKTVIQHIYDCTIKAQRTPQTLSRAGAARTADRSRTLLLGARQARIPGRTRHRVA